MRNLLIAALAACAGSALAQSSGYYVTAGTSGPGTTYELSGGALQNSFAWAADAQMPIILGDFGSGVRIRQAAGQPQSGAPQQGDEYQLNGTPTGFTNLWVSPDPQSTTAYDAGFDGTNTYMVHWGGQTDGQVWTYDNNYGGGQFLFAAASGDLGITFDTSTSTVWTSNFFTGTVTNYSLAGTVLSSFSVGGSAAALAYEASSDSLWLSNTSTNTIIQYNKNGSVMQSYAAPAYVLGGEIYNAVPEPGTFVAIGAGLLALYIRKRAK
jgi:hypothetical protein